MASKMSNYEMVKQFNTVFGHDVAETPQKDIFNSNPKIVKLRNNLISEEYGELIEAFNNRDMVEVIDALCDIQYVAYGLLVVYGVNGDLQFRTNIPSILNPEQGNHPEFETMSNFEITKYLVTTYFSEPVEKSSPSTFFKNLDASTTFHRQVEENLSKIQEDLVKLHESTENEDFDGTVSSSINIIYFTYVIGVLIGADIDLGVNLVHSSNMSKICSNQDDAEQTVEWYKQTDTRYDSPCFRESPEGFVIFNESSGKILKNINYKPVDLSVFMK